jgi:hypothetical protein
MVVAAVLIGVGGGGVCARGWLGVACGRCGWHAAATCGEVRPCSCHAALRCAALCGACARRCAARQGARGGAAAGRPVCAAQAGVARGDACAGRGCVACAHAALSAAAAQGCAPPPLPAAVHTHHARHTTPDAPATTTHTHAHATRHTPHNASQLELAVKTQQADFVDVRVADSLRMVSELELLQVRPTKCVWASVVQKPGLCGSRRGEVRMQSPAGAAATLCLVARRTQPPRRTPPLHHARARAHALASSQRNAQAPGLPFSLPREYAGLPRLVGRATVELTVAKGDDSLAFVDPVKGGLSKQAKVCVRACACVCFFGGGGDGFMTHCATVAMHEWRAVCCGARGGLVAALPCAATRRGSRCPAAAAAAAHAVVDGAAPGAAA